MTEENKENKDEAGNPKENTTTEIEYVYKTYDEYHEFLNSEHTGETLVDFQAKTVRYLPEGVTKEAYDKHFEEKQIPDNEKLICQRHVYLASDRKYHPVINAPNGEGTKLDNIIKRIFFRAINPKIGIDIVKRKSGRYNLRQVSLKDGINPTLPSKHHNYGISRRQLILPKDKAILESIKQGIDKIIGETQPLQEDEKKQLIEGAIA